MGWVEGPKCVCIMGFGLVPQLDAMERSRKQSIPGNSDYQTANCLNLTSQIRYLFEFETDQINTVSRNRTMIELSSQRLFKRDSYVFMITILYARASRVL
ncbi:hypothetical protein VNO77_17086 [Canavalia gladiata]|uniref:Uncharacterized protein n=1 Tax=Canavalia gladiata TaxID=3824 RepID=A0AAN9QMD8_CANGL